MNNLESVKLETLKLIELIKNNSNVEENKNKIVELWKGLDCVELPKENEINLFTKGFKHSEQSVLYLLVQFLSKKGCFDVLEEFENELWEINSKNKQSLCYLKNVIRDFRQFKIIMDDINCRNYDSLESFMSNNNVCSSLWFYFYIYKFLKSGTVKNQLLILTKDVGKYLQSMLGECKKYLKLLIFKDNGESIEYVEQVLEDLFVKEYSRVKLYNDQIYLPDILLVGSSSFNQLRKANSSVIDNEDNILPLEIKLPKGFNYHSLFVCPVLKTLCIDDNKPVLLSCNHVISSSAANVLSKFGASESFKCPYCPEMCNYKSLLVLDL